MFEHTKKFFQFTRSFGVFGKFQMGFLIIGGVIMSFLELAGLSIFFPLLHLIMEPSSIETSGLMRYLSDITGVSDHGQMTMLIGFIIAVIFIFKNVMQVFYLKYEFSILTKWRVQIVSGLYRIYMNSNYEIFMRRSSSQMINLITNSVPYVVNNYVHAILSLINYILTGAVILGYIVYVNWIFAAVIFFCGFFLLKGYSRIFRLSTRRLGEKSQVLSANQYSLLQQSFLGYKETRTHLKELFFAQKFLDNSEDLATTEGRLFFIRNLPPATVEMVIMIMIIIIFEAIILTNNNIAMATAQIGVIVLASMRMIPIINRTIHSILMINSSKAPLEELMQEIALFNIQSGQFRRKKNDHHLVEQEIVSLKFRRQIKLENLSYSYPENEEKALKNINFEIRPGEFIGITGPSGGGKSTLVNILLGFLVNFEGNFSVDDVLIDNDNIRNLRKIVGYVDQHIFMMDVSIAENVAYGVEKEGIDKDRVEQALRKAQLWDFVKDLPQGMYTPVGENGKLLSGGQRQRIAIARAFYRDLKLLILDEASASLDVETEQKLFSFLKTLKGEMAIIMIAHRLSTLRDCDRLLFIEHGRIVDSGDFQELYDSNETFRSYIDYSQIDLSTQAPD